MKLSPFRGILIAIPAVFFMVCDALSGLPKVGQAAASLQELKVCTMPGDGTLSAIEWIERSDWINVKTDVSPPARGDGVSDDTAALQEALDQIDDAVTGKKVIYLPEGNYRITRTLTVTNKPSAMIIGDGSLTRIFWDGRNGERMFWSNGLPRTSYIGIVWDGMGIAGIGIDLDSKSRYETRIMHEYMEFRNFTVAGIRVGHNQKTASAEMMFLNLRFVNNRHGVLIQEWNDYVNVFDGVHFVGNDYGIHSAKGNVTVRNSRFEGSRISDLLLSSHSNSVRRVISSGSQTFIRTITGHTANGPLRVEDSRIEGWLDPDGAIVTSLRGPVMLFNVDFSNPPGPRPPVRLGNMFLLNQVALLSNVKSPETDSVIDRGPNGIVHMLPAGKRNSPRLEPDQTFLRKQYQKTSRVLDVKQDCKARGDGMHDDSEAIQGCLARAAATGKRVTVYFPAGIYKVSQTLKTPPGSNFRIDGTGWHSRIVWSDLRPGTVLHIEDPDGLEIVHITLGGPPGTTSLLQTGNKASAVRYHNVFGYHEAEEKDVRIVFSGLPRGSVVAGGHIDGRIHVRDSSEATILIGFHDAVQMEVSGNSRQSGFLGVLTRSSALSEYPLIVRDNQSIVMTDWYNEQTPHLMLLEGDEQGSGRVIIDHTNAAFTDDIATRVNGYNGLLAQIGGQHGQAHVKLARIISVESDPELDIYLLANMYWHKEPVITGNTVNKFILGNSVNQRRSGINELVRDLLPPGGNSRIKEILDAFSRLGDTDLALNYCL